VPRPPQPIKPTRNLSEPAAKIRLAPPDVNAASDTADALIKSRRETADSFSLAFFFINHPFNKNGAPRLDAILLPKVNIY
jgi:hypothetical protein